MSGSGRRQGPGRRPLKERVRTANKRSQSSTRWLERQLNDPYVDAAKTSGYRSRAAFKIAEIDDKFHLLRPGARVVDLGAAPGGWAQVAATRVRPRETGGKVVAVDINPMEPVAGVDVLRLDFLEQDADQAVKKAVGGEADVVLSDMAAPSTGHRQTDHLRVMALCDAALDFALDILVEGGAFCAKVLRGGAEQELLDRMKRSFRSVRHVKPPASRKDSREMYVVAVGFQGRQRTG